MAFVLFQGKAVLAATGVFPVLFFLVVFACLQKMAYLILALEGF